MGEIIVKFLVSVIVFNVIDESVHVLIYATFSFLVLQMVIEMGNIRPMSNYVVSFADIDNGDVLLVLKDRPAWQAGRLNLVGGKIEDGETPMEAAVRELQEESGLIGDMDKLCGIVRGKEVMVYCCRVKVASTEINPRPGETEKVDWYKWEDVKNDPRLMPNLRVIIPLLKMGVTDWIINDRWSSLDDSNHRIEMILGK